MPAAKKAPLSADYRALSVDRAALNETNDCTVTAVTVATGRPYAEVHAAYARNGRRNGHGVTFDVTQAVLRELGFRAEQVGLHHFLAKTPARWNAKYVTTHHPDRVPEAWADGKTYLMRVNGHILCIKNGVNHDWSRGKSRRAFAVYEVVPA